MDRASGDGEGETGGDDQDDSYKQSKTKHVLEEFRKEWKKEIENSPKRIIKKNDSFKEPDPIPLNIEDKAKVLFQLGVENEDKGKLYEAIQYYRRAVQLVPDIEYRLLHQPAQQTEVGSGEESCDEEDVESCEEDLSEQAELQYRPGTDLLVHLSLVSHKYHKIPLCHPHTPVKTTHLSALPMEIFLYILRWVVSSELDFRSLELCSRVCRGFYLCCRDQEIWRTACSRVWGVKCGGMEGFLSWRDMYIHRPRLCFGGCYISKTTYFRHGENSFQDQFYRPWQLVEYFRYLRFFPDGRVLSLTTPEEPPVSVGLLRARSPPPRHPPIFTGYYRLHDSTVSVVLSRGPDKGKRPPSTTSLYRDTFHIELEIVSYKNRLHGQLVWRGYSVFSRRNDVETNTPFDLPPARYPPFWFSRVKSYSAETHQPLCK